MEIEFQIGNTHEELKKADGTKKGVHKWACYVKATDPDINRNLHKIIYKVKFELHETFR